MVLSRACPFKVARGSEFALQGCFMCGHGPIFLHLLLIVLFSGGIFVIVPIIVCLVVLAVTARANYVWEWGPMGLVRTDSVVCRVFLGCGLFFVVCRLGRFLALVAFPPFFFLGQLLSCKANVHSEHYGEKPAQRV
ncbi:hypothetical protein JB92DRAFT_2894451 [Gautieria morchelliformis]|nr:hypothetical protein JB92DRAFT_2894451 [Gautieria morchelliformis]